MPDSDPSSSSSANPPPDQPSEPRNLPALVPPAAARENGDNMFSRWMRALFGWRSGSVRADLKVVLEESAPTETGFSPEEVTLLKNILGLRERRVSDVMVPRADIIAVQQDIAWSRCSRARGIRGSWCSTTPSTIRSAWCTSAT
jgi:hypothetical protein